MSNNFEHGDLVEFRVFGSTTMRGRVYTTLKTGLIVVMVGSTLYDALPQDVKKISEQVDDGTEVR